MQYIKKNLNLKFSRFYLVKLVQSTIGEEMCHLTHKLMKYTPISPFQVTVISKYLNEIFVLKGISLKSNLEHILELLYLFICNVFNSVKKSLYL